MRRDYKPVVRAGQSEQGVSLVIVLILLGAMALGSVAALRNTAGSLQLGRAWLMQTLAWEQAHAGLRHCEGQLLLPSALRDPRLADPALLWSSPSSRSGTRRLFGNPALKLWPPFCLPRWPQVAARPAWWKSRS